MFKTIFTLVPFCVGCVIQVDDKPGIDDTGDTTDEADADTDADADADSDADTDTDFAVACAGTHSGLYSGDDAGTANADLHEDGELEMTFVNFVELNVSGNVTGAGVVSGQGYGIRIAGDYDFSDCSASGTWEEIAGADNGTWTLQHD